MQNTKVWFITGASKGLGLMLVRELLKQNYLVAATSRTIKSLKEAVGAHKNFYPLAVDITNNNAVAQAIHDTVTQFGQIDVIVNNAGYSQTGTIEELTEAEVKMNFDVNVYGSLNVIRNVVPYFRKQKSGHIFNISSIGGLVGNFPAFGIYCASKFAVAGFTEALAEEMKAFNIRTTLVYPGYFRTNFLSAGSIQTPQHPIEAYYEARELEAAHLNQINGNQPNDPQKAAELFITLSNLDNPPVHFFMGKDAYEVVQGKIALLQEASEKWKAYSCSTAF